MAVDPSLADPTSPSGASGSFAAQGVPYPVFHYGNSKNHTSATDGQVWTYDSADSKWNPEAAAGGATTLDGLTDTTITTPADNQFLRYDGAGWVNESVSVTGASTPDGVTSVANLSAFNPRDYGASYLDTSQYITSSTTTSTATFDSGTDIVTFAGSHGLADGDGICFSTSGTLPTLASGTLTASTRVWVDVLSATTASLHTTRTAALAGTGDLDFTGAGSGTHTGRLKTTVTFTVGAAANTYVAGQGMLLLKSGPECSISTPVETFDGVPATYGTKFGTDPTFTIVDSSLDTDVLDLNADVPLTTGDAVYVSSATTLPAGLSASTNYYVRGPIETQTVAISGTPTAGDFTLTWAGGSTTAIPHTTGTPASAATVQAAVRLISGLSEVTVTQSGSGTNLTYTLVMAGTTGFNIAQMTSSHALTGGTPVITHATTDDGSDKFILYDTSGHATSGGATGKIAITDAGTGTHTMVGRTEHYLGVREGDGQGGWTAALNIGPLYQFNYRNFGQTTYGLDWQVHLAVGARSVATYGFGSSGRDLIRVTGAEGTRFGAAEGGDNSFNSVSNNAGSARFVCNNTVGIVVNDIVEVNATSSGDSAYDGQWKVTAVATDDVTTTVAWGTTASGYLQRAYNRYRDYGQVLAQDGGKGVPSTEYAGYEWRASTVQPIGTNVLDATNNRLWTVAETGLTNPGSSRSGASAPSWSTSLANSRVADGFNILRLATAWVPTEDTSGAVRQAMSSVVSSVGATTAVLRDAAFADITGSALVASHDDTLALRKCVAAANAHAADATIELSAGEMPIYSWKLGTTDNEGVSRYTNVANTNGPLWAQEQLGDTGNSVSVLCHPGSTIRWRSFETRPRNDHVTVSNGTTTPWGLAGDIALFSPSSLKFAWHGGRVIWEDFCGGMSEHVASNTFGTGPLVFTACSVQYSSGYTPQDISIVGGRFFAPNFCTFNGQDNDQQYFSQVKLLLRDNIIAVGGSDGAQTMLPHGNLESENNWLMCYRLYSSHGYYWNVTKYNYRSHGDRLFGFAGSNNYAIQMRGSNNNEPVRDCIVTDLFTENCGDILVGEPTVSNPVRNIQMSNIRAGVSCAESHDVQITNMRGALTLREGGTNLQLNGLQGNLVATPSEQFDGLQVSGIQGADYVGLDNLQNSTVRDIKFRNNPVANVTSVTDSSYSWVARGVNGEYRLTNKANSAPALTTQPTRLVMDDLVTMIATTGFGALPAGTGAWGDPDGLGYSYLVVRTSGSTDPDTEPYGYVRHGEVTSVESFGLRLGDLDNTTVEGVRSTRSDGTSMNLVSYPGSDATARTWNNSWIKDVLYEDLVAVPTSTHSLIHFGTSASTHFINSGLDGIVLRPNVASARLAMIRGAFSDDSRFVFKNIDVPLDLNDAESGIYVSSANGHGTLENCKLQHNEALMSLDATADTMTTLTWAQLSGAVQAGAANTTTAVILPTTALTYDDAYNLQPIVLVHGNGLIERNVITDYVGSTKVATLRNTMNIVPNSATNVHIAGNHLTRGIADANTTMPIRIYATEALPTATVDGGGAITLEGETFWYRGSNDKVYNSEANAVSGGATGDLEFVGNNVVCTVRVEGYADANDNSTIEPFNGTHPANWVKSAKNVDLRGGGGVWKYVEVAAAQVDNLDLYPVDVHQFTTSAATNLITGFNGGWPGRRIQLYNADSADNIIFDHDNGAAGSLRKNKIMSPTGADFTLSAGETITLIYVDAATGWVIQNYIAWLPSELDLPRDVLRLPELWAIEPKRQWAMAG